jgi:hypothetical protein
VQVRGCRDDDHAFAGTQAAADEALEGIEEREVVTVDLHGVLVLSQLGPERARAGIVQRADHAP